MYTCIGSKNRGAKAQSDGVRGDDVLAKEYCLYERDRRLRCEDEKTSLRLSVMCGLLLFFSSKLTLTSSIRDRLPLSSKTREQPFTVSLERRLSTDGKTTGECELWSFSSWSGSEWSPQKKKLNEKTSVTWSFVSLANEAFQVKKAVCDLRHFFGFFCRLLVQSWRRPICREMTGISRHATWSILLAWSMPQNDVGWSHGRLTSEHKASTSLSSFINHSTLVLERSSAKLFVFTCTRVRDRLRTRQRVGVCLRAVEVIICMITRDLSVISIDVTGVSLYLSISLYYSQKLTHAQYRKRFRTS